MRRKKRGRKRQEPRFLKILRI